GPWALLDSILVGQVNDENIYEYLDTDPVFKLGEKRYYSVVSVDDKGNFSGRTNITRHDKNVASVEKMQEVFVVPNPFKIESGFGGKVGAEDKIGFYGLPKKCSIRIYSYAGQLVETIEHDDPVYTTAWFQVTRNEQEIASGIYLYVITTPDGEKASGKFIIVK
ncbi:MAG TPA: T9SS type A sorting domain-containing protein, partial [bacterium]